MSQPDAYIVVDLGFGDAGKGTIVDSLVRRTGAKMVVRFNGGAQAGHNVVEKDRHHTFSQWGSGTFAGAHTFMSKFVAVHPTAALVEAERLEKVGIAKPLSLVTIDAQCPITTPYHQAMNRLRELVRGDARHGSCGVGFGETIADLAVSDAIRAHELLDEKVLRAKLVALRKRKMDESKFFRRSEAAARQFQILEDPKVIDRTVEAFGEYASGLNAIIPAEKTSWAAHPQSIVFEGAQGILLDEWKGFHPYTTWSTCTSENAFAVLRQLAWGGGREVIGVVRPYMIRHGAGPLVSEEPFIASPLMSGEHNHTNDWQQHVRIGWLDTVALSYAAAMDKNLMSIAVTCIDRLEKSKPFIPEWQACVGYRFRGESETRFSLDVVKEASNFGERTAFTMMMMHAHPVLTKMPNVQEHLSYLVGCTGKPIICESRGPTAEDKTWRW